MKKIKVKGMFTGLYDRNGKPIHDGDKYKIYSIFGDKLGSGEPWEEGIHTVKYVIWGDNAGYTFPDLKRVELIK